MTETGGLPFAAGTFGLRFDRVGLGRNEAFRPDLSARECPAATRGLAIPAAGSFLRDGARLALLEEDRLRALPQAAAAELR